MRKRSYRHLIQFVLIWTVIVESAVAEQITALFLGNSHTYFNDLPMLVQNLATAGGDTLMVDSSTPGGCTLAYPPNAHLYNDISLGLLEIGDWDYVVLQEQSQIPVIRYIRDHYMYPGSIVLDSLAHAATTCCVTTFFMTWGWEDGGQHSFGGYTSPDFADYDEMQDSVRTAYMRIADSLSTPVAPAGVAWQNAIHDGFPLSLFNPDGYHPSLAGSYLAACVFYATFFQKSPFGLVFTAGLSDEHAAWLQAIADTTVLLHLQEWNIDPAMPYVPFEFHWAVEPAVSRQMTTGLFLILEEWSDGVVGRFSNTHGSSASLWRAAKSRFSRPQCPMTRSHSTPTLQNITPAFRFRSCRICSRQRPDSWKRLINVQRISASCRVATASPSIDRLQR